MEFNTIQLKLSLSEVNKILTTMGSLPYSKVYELIQKIQEQTEKELQNQPDRVIDTQKEALNGSGS